MKPTTIPTIQPIEDTMEKRCIGGDFKPHLDDLNEEYIKQNLGVDDE